MEASFKSLLISLAVMVVALIATGEAARIHASGSTICGMSQDELLTCKDAVSSGSITPPSTDCCTALVHADVPCLCKYQKSGYMMLLGINGTRALELPSMCDPTQATAHC